MMATARGFPSVPGTYTRAAVGGGHPAVLARAERVEALLLVGVRIARTFSRTSVRMRRRWAPTAPLVAALATEPGEGLARLVEDRVELGLLRGVEREVPDERRAHLAEAAATTAPGTPGARGRAPSARASRRATRRIPGRGLGPRWARGLAGVRGRPEAKRRVGHPEGVLAAIDLHPHVGRHSREAGSGRDSGR